MYRKRKLFCILFLVISIFGLFRIYACKYKNISFVTYTVKPGDTLYSIAKKTSPNTDIRKVIYEIREVNDITPIIYPGQEIKVPVKK